MGLSRGMFRLLWSVFFCFLAREHYVFWIFYLARLSLRKSHPACFTKVWKWRIKNDLRLDCFGAWYSKKLFPPLIKDYLETFRTYEWFNMTSSTVPPRLMHFGSRGPSESMAWPFVSDTSPKFIGPGGLGRRCKGTRQCSNNELQEGRSSQVIWGSNLMHGLKIWPWQNQTLYVLKRWKEQMKVICSWCDLCCE